MRRAAAETSKRGATYSPHSDLFEKHRSALCSRGPAHCAGFALQAFPDFLRPTKRFLNVVTNIVCA
jgi:hypothetical protein